MSELQPIEDLLTFMVTSIVDSPDDVSIAVDDTGDRPVFELSVAEADLPRIIGRRGAVASALRSAMDLAAYKADIRVQLRILDGQDDDESVGDDAEEQPEA